MRIIPGISQGIKSFFDSRLLLPLLIVLVGIGSFGLGILAERAGNDSEEVVIQAPEASFTDDGGGSVVASRSGSKYHYPWCPGASQMKEENKIWFDSADAARHAGYQPARNCKGLE